MRAMNAVILYGDMIWERAQLQIAKLTTISMKIAIRIILLTSRSKYPLCDWLMAFVTPLQSLQIAFLTRSFVLNRVKRFSRQSITWKSNMEV